MAEGVQEGVLTVDDIPDIEAMVGGAQLPMPVWSPHGEGMCVHVHSRRGGARSREEIDRDKALAGRAGALIERNRRVWMWMVAFEPSPRPSYAGFQPSVGWDVTREGWKEIARQRVEFGDLKIASP